MATKKHQPQAKKKPTSFANQILDGVGWIVKEAALPIPDSLLASGKMKQKDAKSSKKRA